MMLVERPRRACCGDFRLFAILVALAASGCAPPGYMYETGSFAPHPTRALCASHGQVLDDATKDCVTPPPPPPPTPAQIEYSKKASDATREVNACITAADAKFHRQLEEAVAKPWRAEMITSTWKAETKHCFDVALSRLVAQKINLAECSSKMDWMLQYRMLVSDPNEKAMAEDRYAEICGKK